MQNYKTLNVWQRSHNLVKEIYLATKGFPREELYGLTGQIRRAAISVPSNIAEGCGRGGNSEISRYLTIAMGSLCESEYQLFLAYELNYMQKETYQAISKQIVETKRMLSTLTGKVKQAATSQKSRR